MNEKQRRQMYLLKEVDESLIPVVDYIFEFEDNMERFIELFKNAIAKDGYTPRKGVDYFTESEVKSLFEELRKIKVSIDEEKIISEVRKQIREPMDGRDADEDSIVEKVLARLPKPKDGETPDAGLIMKQVMEKIKEPKDGLIGPMPKHEVVNGSIRFQNPDGTWGEWINLRTLVSETRLGRGTYSGGIYVKEMVTGTINGVNTAFTIAHTPSSTQPFHLILNGSILTETDDYTISGMNISMVDAPMDGSKLQASYYY